MTVFEFNSTIHTNDRTDARTSVSAFFPPVQIV